MGSWGVPQYIMIILIVMRGVPVKKDSIEKSATDLMAALLLCCLLGWGGFWS